MPLINNDKGGRRITLIGAVAAAEKRLALTAAILFVLILAVILLR
jgi:hypothetical protein